MRLLVTQHHPGLPVLAASHKRERPGFGAQAGSAPSFGPGAGDAAPSGVTVASFNLCEALAFVGGRKGDDTCPTGSSSRPGTQQTYIKCWGISY